MNVLYLSDSYTPHDTRFLDAIRHQGHRVWYASYLQKSTLPPVTMNVPIWPYSFSDGAAFNSAIVQHGIDVVQVGPLKGFCPSILENVPCAVVAASWAFDVLLKEDDPNILDGTARILKRADALIADCQSVVDKILEIHPTFSAPVVKFPWGIDLERFSPLPLAEAQKLRHRLGWTENVVFVSTRTWDKIYGVETVIDAFAEAHRLRPDVRLLQIGSGPMFVQIQEKIDALGIRDCVQTPGLLPEKELPIWFSAADVYVSAARCDGTSISLLEAMACEKPVMVNNQFGNCEWVVPEVNGWLLDCTNKESLSSGMLTAYSERESWESIGRANRKKVLQHANWETNQHQISIAYESAIARRQRTQGFSRTAPKSHQSAALNVGNHK